MEPTSQKQLVFTNFEGFERIAVPSLCEIWNWEGDKTVLPTKWSETLKSSFNIDMSSQDLKNDYAENSKFDPNAFFFVTYRSSSIGWWLVWPEDDGKYTLKFLWAGQRYRDQNLEQALAGLAIEYMNQHKPDVGKLYISPFDDTQYDKLQEMGFVEE